MNKKNWKRFFAMDRHNAQGFTLVELIVVIAILAILAGVAVPAYNGYIEKAKKAGDEQLLAAVNTAYAAACLENGVDMADMTSAQAKIGLANNTVNSIGPAEYQDAFFKYFAGNENTEFAVIKGLKFDDENKVFVENAGMVGLTYGGGTIYIDPADLADFKNSTFANDALGLGVYNVLEQVDDVTGMVSLFGRYMMNVYQSDAYQEASAKALGIDTTKETWKDDLQDKLDAMSAASGTSKNDIMANAAVMFAAKNATTMQPADVKALLSSESGYESIRTELLGTNTADGLAHASLFYGMYMSWAHSNQDAKTMGYAENPVDALKHWDTFMNSDETTPEEYAYKQSFIKYVNGTQGNTDLEGYVGALNMINSSTGDPAAVEHLVTNGFGANDQGKNELGDLLLGEMNK